MGFNHSDRAPAPGLHRDAGWSHRLSHACCREATRPARAGATEGTGSGEVPVDGGAPGATSTRGTARGNVRTPHGRGRSAASGRGGEHPGASGRAIARETLPCAAKTWEVGDGSKRSRAEAGGHCQLNVKNDAQFIRLCSWLKWAYMYTRTSPWRPPPLTRWARKQEDLRSSSACIYALQTAIN